MIGYLALNAPLAFMSQAAKVANAEGGADKVEIYDRLKNTPYPYRLHGYPHPTVFKTIRNAMRSAGPDGHVLLLDLTLLPVIRYETLGAPDQKAIERTWMQTHMLDDLGTSPAQWQKKLGIEINHLAPRDLEQQLQEAEMQMVKWTERAHALNERMKAIANGTIVADIRNRSQP